ncbi:MAG: hypothetical protein E7301_08470 [Butyrivibrio sp.]|uniref:hypothetical protein n=1 Tax=Butyrivibrio sp. NC2002 TaxID=1410610 RepID=UPI0005668364|nr:hypothetical protein [Butyrivibrio sp. NC2002]MBE5860141.1 hypothetical protein [Butyrivibrio sp.]
MHIAVFDDNIADRKQMERLLKRQSDRYQKEGKEHFYIDSYGNIEALLRFPQLYDIIFIDMCGEESESEHFKNGLDVAKILFEAGGMKNVVMCSSKYNYRELAKEENFYDQLQFLDKAIRVKDLEECLAECERRLGSPIPTLELRGETETIYAREEDIICAKADGPYKVSVFFTGGRELSIISDIVNLYEECEIFDSICPVSQSALINVMHIKSENFTSVVMDNGMTVKVALTFKGNIKKVKQIVAAKEQV